MSDIQLTGKLGQAREAACKQLDGMLRSPSAHLRDFAHRYIDYVLTGRNMPSGTPTAELSRTVARAVTLGLQQAYGTGSTLAAVDSSIRTRLSVLVPSKEDVKQ